MAKSSTDAVITTVGDIYAKLPNLPKDAREVIVKITPWVALIGGVLLLLIYALGLVGSTVMAPLAAVSGVNVGYGIVFTLLGLVASALLVASFPGTKIHKIKGWNLLFWSEAVYLVGQVLKMDFMGVLLALIMFYLIFQIRSYYK